MKQSVLIISEKPSAGVAIAKVLGKFQRHEGYLEGDGWMVSWCLGHLVEQVRPDGYDPRYAKWRYEDLPIIPQDWKFAVIEQSRKQYEILTALMNAPAVERIVEATDAGREGELIFRLVYQHCGCSKPFSRLWLSSMEDSAIRRGMENLREGALFDNLYQAALCRLLADWLVGMNATRLFCVLYGGAKLNIGRVITPTLALLTEKEAEIAAFHKEKFYTVELNLHGFRAASGRFTERKEAEQLRAACEGQTAVVRSVNQQIKTECPPKLYDLTTLQREANRLFGFTAQKTLDIAQSLYEKKLATYPRTDSRYLTDDMADGIPLLCETAAKSLPFVRDCSQVSHVEALINNAKVSDHHAIIPTLEIGKADLSSLTADERTVLNMIVVRLLCAVGEAHRYAESAVTLDCGGGTFSAKGRTVTAEGWKSVETAFRETLKQKERLEEEPAVPLPPLTEGEHIENAGAAVREGTTKPPARFTDDTLLAAMKNAGAEDFAKIDNPERVGLGTSATQAGIIEKLIKGQYVERKKKQLVPTQKAMELIGIVPERIKSAKLTAEWEEKLKAIERGVLEPSAFLAGIESMITELVRSYDGVTVDVSALKQSQSPIVGICPRCGRNVTAGEKGFFCEGYRGQNPCRFALWKDNKFFQSQGKTLTKRTAEALLKDGRVHMTKLRSAKSGKEYDATIVMEDAGERVNFHLEFDRQSQQGKQTISPAKK